jgi:hypothetical protein
MITIKQQIKLMDKTINEHAEWHAEQADTRIRHIRIRAHTCSDN